MSAQRFSLIPVWNGNRILDPNHVAQLRTSIRSPLDLDIKPQHIVRYEEPKDGEEAAEGGEHGGPTVKQCVVDGQHRQALLRECFTNPFQEDFQVLVIEKVCASENDIIQYFKVLNQTKSIPWLEDPKMAANRQLEALIKKFNLPKFERIRSGATRHPQLSADELRIQMIKHRVGLDTQEMPDNQAERMERFNIQELTNLDNIPEDEMNTRQKSAARIQFALGLLPGWSWLKNMG